MPSSKIINILSVLAVANCPAQNVKHNLDAAVKQLLASDDMQHGQLSFCVTDAQGQSVYQHQSQLALSPASTQKIFVAIAALEQLGPDFQFQTRWQYSGKIAQQTLQGNLYLQGQGDPSLGSSPLSPNAADNFLASLVAALKAKNISKIDGDLYLNDTYFDQQTLPGGWPWNDIGNYYGAGVFGLNWRENYYTLSIKGGQNVGDSTQIIHQNPKIEGLKLANFCKTGPVGSGDKSLVFAAPQQFQAYVNGTVPAQKTTLVKAAMPNPALLLGQEIAQALRQNGIAFDGKIKCLSEFYFEGKQPKVPTDLQLLSEHKSAPLKNLVALYLQKSINLYGEALLKTMALKSQKSSEYPVACQALKNFWQSKGLAKNEIDFIDGSGLSPQNYVSSSAQVKALNYAKTQSYFDDFYQALPYYNGMKMKSGSISQCKAFAGYHESKSGQKYQFSIILNHYTGPKPAEAIYRVLDALK
jgi:serine-type D-Ala-D-Ala carboxypeptidase/endopeptidase (penicillin-binding protein 4)